MHLMTYHCKTLYLILIFNNPNSFPFCKQCHSSSTIIDPRNSVTRPVTRTLIGAVNSGGPGARVEVESRRGC